MDAAFRYYTLPKILAGLVIVLAVVLGLAVGGYQPLADALHLRTTIPYYVTLTRIVTNTTILTTTIIVNHTLTVATTTTSLIILTSIYTNTTTVRTVIIQPVTTTVTTTTTLITPIYYTTTTTFTETISNITLPPLDIYNASSIRDYLIANWTLGWLGFIRGQNLTQYGFCIGTLYILPNASVIWLGAWIMPWWYAVQFMNSEYYIATFPGGYSEYEAPGPGIAYMVPGEIYPPWSGVAYGVAYLVNIDDYPFPNYTVAVTGEVGGTGITLRSIQWDFKNLNNGTYVMALVPPMQNVILVPNALCLVQVIRVNPTTPNSILLNMTYWGAQYWAWVRSMAYFGRPAPCYEPFEWTIGWWLYRLNITMPIGQIWQYYCGPNGIWRSLKP